MDFAPVLFGWLAAAITAALGIPQAIRITRSASAAGVSLWSWQAIFWSGLAWTCYGAWTARLPVIAPNVLLTAGAIAVLYLIAEYRESSFASFLILPVLGAGCSLALWGIFGEIAYVAVMAVPALSGRVSQLVTALTSFSVGGLSISTLALAVASQILWVAYGMLTGSHAIVVLGIPVAIIAATTILVVQYRILFGADDW